MTTDAALRSTQTISRAALTAAQRFGNRPALRYLSGGAWHTDTFSEVSEAVEALGGGLVSRGIEPVLEHDLSHEEGELTPTLKVRRKVVYERYADVLDALYR